MVWSWNPHAFLRCMASPNCKLHSGLEKSSRGLQHKFAGFGQENGAFNGDLMMDLQQFHSDCKLPTIWIPRSAEFSAPDSVVSKDCWHQQCQESSSTACGVPSCTSSNLEVATCCRQPWNRLVWVRTTTNSGKSTSLVERGRTGKLA